jgi:hypothetical protein
MNRLTHIHCLKTGCGLYVESNARWAWGDLYLCGDVYIFNAVNIDGLVEWGESLDDFARRPDAPHIRIPVDSNWMEKRGLIIVHRLAATQSRELEYHLESS